MAEGDDSGYVAPVAVMGDAPDYSSVVADVEAGANTRY